MRFFFVTFPHACAAYILNHSSRGSNYLSLVPRLLLIDTECVFFVIFQVACAAYILNHSSHGSNCLSLVAAAFNE